MFAKKHVNVVKVPLGKRRREYEKAFPRMPILYLELLENKDKIKPALVNEPYKPPTDNGYSEDYREDKYSEDRHREDYREDKYSEDRRHDDRYRDEDDEFREDDEIDNASEFSDNSAIQSRLDNLLRTSPHSKKYSPSPNPKYYSRHGTPKPPTLQDLQKAGLYNQKKELVDARWVNEQQEEDAKRELLFKFDLLRKSYPNSTIQEFSIHSDYDTMQKTYESSVRRLSIDSSVENYKTYLIGGFMAVEFLFGNLLGFDMQGFTQQQIVSMHSYEKLLIELGEKTYVPTGSKWPVELRLLFLVIMNAAFFIISKMILNKTGANLLGMINNMNSVNASSQQKRKMKGPNINLDDIPDI